MEKESSDYRIGRDKAIEELVGMRVPSRMHAKDESVFDFAADKTQVDNSFMGWADLASNPPCSICEIKDLAARVLASGLRHVVLIAQGGSAQAPLTLSRYRGAGRSDIVFTVLDAVYPALVRKACWDYPLEETLFIVSSKSGSTIEPRFVLEAVRTELAKRASFECASKRMIAITDPGSNLEKQAKEEGWLAVLPGEPTVGGRFSALSVFGLLPAALMGLDIDAAFEQARQAEASYALDSPDNPAVQLAAFLYGNYRAGRDKCTLLLPPEGRTLGLWTEQLVAESLGKDGLGMVPLTETDPALLADSVRYRCAVAYDVRIEGGPCTGGAFRAALEDCCAQADIPRFDFTVTQAEDLASHFLMWEYAVAFCGFLMKVYPFDQPDVIFTKRKVLELLNSGRLVEGFSEGFSAAGFSGVLSVSLSGRLGTCDTLRLALQRLFASVEPSDYFSLNAFVPDADAERCAVLERLRWKIARFTQVPTCLEMGSRYLHSTGQLHKGGPNNGVFLIVSADETEDIPLPSEAQSLGVLSKTQAHADFSILAERGRRCVHVHLPLHTPSCLHAFEALVEDVFEDGALEQAGE